MKYKYLLDTNVLSEMARHPSGPLARRISDVGEEVICTSIIVACEVHYGLIKRGSPQLTRRMTNLLAAMEVLTEFPADTGVHYGRIRAKLESMGQPIGPNDLLIAAHARAAGLTLVTGNFREFRRVPELLVENWQGRDEGSV